MMAIATTHQNGWQQTKWGALATLEYGRSLRDYDEEQSETKSIQVYGTNGPIGWHSSPLCETPGVVVGRKGAYRGIHFSPEPFFVIDTAFYLRHKAEFDIRWAYYQLKDFDINKIDSGSAIPSTSRDAFYEIPVSLPPLPVQRRIAGILSAYDELIENSQRRIKILEVMARALYREWFVHFRFPGHEKVPRVASPIGDIPQGWEVRKLGDVADISWGDTSTTKASYVEDGYAAYSASGMDGKLDHFDFDRVGVVLSAIGAQCGRTWLARGKWSCIKNTIRFWSKDDTVSTEFLFIATEGQDFWPRRGAAQPFISQGDAERKELIIPDNGSKERFTAFVADTLEKISVLEAQIKNLRRTRDLMLPRLLSGQIDMQAA
jgi:type I restriction enzyme S subunit